MSRLTISEWESFVHRFAMRPQAWVRPQFRILQNKKKRTARWPAGEPFLQSYNSQPMQRALESIQKEARAAWGPRKPVDSIVELEVGFFMPMPKSRPKNHIGLFAPGEPHVIKPDTSNLLKLVEDGLQGIWFSDDARIYDVRGLKVYASGQPEIVVGMRWRV